MKDLIGRVANALSVGASVDDLRSFMMLEDMSEGDMYLTYIAGQMLLEARSQMPPSPKPKVRRIP